MGCALAETHGFVCELKEAHESLWEKYNALTADRDRLAGELAAIKAEVGPLLDDLANYAGMGELSCGECPHHADVCGMECEDSAKKARAWAARLGSKPAE